MLTQIGTRKKLKKGYLMKITNVMALLFLTFPLLSINDSSRPIITEKSTKSCAPQAYSADTTRGCCPTDQCPRGPRGFRGKPGKSKIGATGATGEAGIAGATGATGATGASGGGSSCTTENMIYVSLDGNDITGDGSFCNPFLTIQQGINTAYSLYVSDTDVTNRPCVYVMPGTYTEDIVLKANVTVRGLGFNNTRISGNLSIDNTFTPGADLRGGLADLGVYGDATFDFLSVSSVEGKIYAWNVRFGANVTFISNFSIINQFLMFGGEIFGTYTQTGMVGLLYGVIMQNNVGSGPNVVLNEQTGQTPYFCQFGGVRYNTQVNATTLGFIAYLEGDIWQNSTLELNGTNVSIVSSAQSLPLISDISYTGGATASQVTLLNDVFGLAYTPTTPADWSPAPINAQEALDQIGARLTAGGL
jgi:hypothetical protein